MDLGLIYRFTSIARLPPLRVPARNVEMNCAGEIAMLRRRVSGKTVSAAIGAELLLIVLSVYWYAGTPGWRHDDGGPSVTVHLQYAPHVAPLARGYHT